MRRFIVFSTQKQVREALRAIPMPGLCRLYVSIPRVEHKASLPVNTSAAIHLYKSVRESADLELVAVTDDDYVHLAVVHSDSVERLERGEWYDHEEVVKLYAESP